MLNQRTLCNSVQISGIGLHSGQNVHMTLLPHVIDGGIIFRRIDLEPYVDIPAQAHLVQDAIMCTTLMHQAVRISTIEHMMSALAALGIDNLIIAVSASELPIMDGSAKPFIDLMLAAGLQEQSAAKKFLRIVKAIEVMQVDKRAAFSPFHGFRLDFEINFNHPAFTVDNQSISFNFSSESFIDHISQARTFGFMRDLAQLKQHHLALGASLDNAIGLDETQVLNPDGLRFDNECVRHKILDAIGDLYLIGYPIIGKFDAYKSGHALNNQLIQKILANPDCFEIVTFNNIVDCPISYVNLS